jgi:uncharacterized metal-binding protein YceD (DUF177 family)
MTPEFSRPLPIERIGPAGLDISVEANAGELVVLAKRLRLPAVGALSCHFRLRPAPGGAIAAEGWLAATVTQTCVVSLEDFDAPVADHFTLRFVPEGTEAEEVDPDSEDEIPFADRVIDLGEAATEQLALDLDPWPRKPGAVLPAGEEDSSAPPFAALTRLRRPS